MQRNRGRPTAAGAILTGMIIGALVSLGLGPRTPTLGAGLGDRGRCHSDRADSVAAVDRPGGPGIPALAASATGLLFLLTLVIAAVRAGDRLAVVNGVLSGAAGLLILLAHGPWSLVPGWVWGRTGRTRGGLRRRGGAPR